MFVLLIYTVLLVAKDNSKCVERNDYFLKLCFLNKGKSIFYLLVVSNH